MEIHLGRSIPSITRSVRKGWPRIGVTGPRRGGVVAWLFTALAIYRAGGIPRRLQPGEDLDISTLDGLVLGGGADLDPKFSRVETSTEVIQAFATASRTPHHRLMAWIALPLIYLLRRIFSINEIISPDLERDEFEIAILQAILEQRKPVLGICRGAQLINAVFGGSLHPEIRGFYDETTYVHSVLRRKKIHIAPNTRLSRLLPRGAYWVNSLHHQAVQDVGPLLKISARESNGLAQAVESNDNRFILGVQWHPEFLPHAPSQLVLFRTLVKEAQRHGDLKKD